MKKAFATIALILPLTVLLCACGETSPNLHANWYKDGGKISATKSEQLEYTVTFKPATETTVLPVTYGAGTYTSELKVETVTLSEGKQEIGYHLHTELSMPVTYTAENSTVSATDSVVSDVWFMDLDHNLQPVKSEKRVHSTSPVNAQEVEVYDYTYTVEYTDTLKKNKITFEQTLPEAKSAQKSLSVNNKDIFFDNEQLLFLLRGMESVALSLKTINPLTMKTSGVQVASPVALAYNTPFTVNGEEINAEEGASIQSYLVSLKYNAEQSGAPQMLVYASNTTQEKGENLYRNVLLQMRVSVLGGVGALEYQLKTATFRD